MKKIILFMFLLFFYSNSFAMNPADYLAKVPVNFKWECYESYWKIDKSVVWDNNNKYQTYKIKSDKTQDLVFTQFWFVLPYKYYNDTKNNYDYKNNLWLNNNYFTDYNNNTFRELNSKEQNGIILTFYELPEKGNFSFIFDYSSNNYTPSFYISDNKTKWNLIKKQDLEDFSFKYLKIEFVANTKESFLENIKINELNFPKKSDTFLVKSFYNDDIEIYSSYKCRDKDFVTEALNYDNFPISKDTKIIEANIVENPKYNVYSKKDADNDWVEDENDNCKNNYNPDQSDINGDWIWDICSDDDKDGFIWYYDNCIQVYNPDQKDVNRNKVWDVCEFDKDKDMIFDSQDNCINTSNTNQKDDDGDGIWNVCDNCKSYNSTQIDLNQNGIWDVCEEIEKNLKENDFDKDWIIDFQDNCAVSPVIYSNLNLSKEEMFNLDKKKYFNPKQEDFDNDWVGDLCDNCSKVQNNDQKDENQNWIGDICEDSDKDWIDWLRDNCINIANPDQKDSDNDWIGNSCEDDDWDNVLFANDNCPFAYNPDQTDIDSDKIGDSCDDKDNRYIESNSTFFIWLIVLITIIFLSWILLMIKKLK